MPPKTEDLSTFDKRVQRIDPDFKPTRGRRFKLFLARRVHMPWIQLAIVLLFVYGVLTVTKVVMENELGAEGFDQRVARMSDGDDAARFASKLLWRDPVMAFVQDNVVTPYFKE